MPSLIRAWKGEFPSAHHATIFLFCAPHAVFPCGQKRKMSARKTAIRVPKAILVRVSLKIVDIFPQALSS